MDLIRLLISQQGNPSHTVSVLLPDDIPLKTLFEATRTLMETKDVKHAFSAKGSSRQIAMSQEPLLEAKTLLMTSDALELKLGAKQYTISLQDPDSPVVQGDGARIVSLSGNRATPEVILSKLENTLLEQSPAAPDPAPEKDKDREVEVHMVTGNRKILFDPDKDREVPDVKDLPQFMQDMLKKPDYVRNERGFVSLNTPGRVQKAQDDFENVKKSSRGMLVVRRVGRSLLDTMENIGISQLSEFCRFLSIPLRRNATAKSAAKALHAYLMENPQYWFYVLRPELYDLLKTFAETPDGSEIAASVPHVQFTELVQIGILELVPANATHLTVELPSDLQVLLDALATVDSATLYALLDTADETLRKYLEAYGVLDAPTLMKLGGDGISQFTSERELLSYMRFHGFHLFDIRTLQTVIGDRTIPLITSAHFDIQYMMEHRMGREYKMFSPEEIAIIREDPRQLTPCFDRLRRFLDFRRSQGFNRNDKISDEALNELMDEIYIDIVSGFSATTIMNDIADIFHGATPCDCGITYLLVLDCTLRMPTGVRCGYSRHERILLPGVSGIIDPNCEVEFDTNLIPVKAMYFEDPMLQSVFFLTLYGISLGDPIQRLEEMGRESLHSDINPEFHLYLLFALIAYHRDTLVPAQILQVKEKSPYSQSSVDWFVREARIRQEEIPDDMKAMYQAYT